MRRQHIPESGKSNLERCVHAITKKTPSRATLFYPFVHPEYRIQVGEIILH